MLISSQYHGIDNIDNDVEPSVKKVKILFYHAGSNTPASHVEKTAWLYPAALQLKTYIDLFYPELVNKLEWIIPIQQEITNQELIDYVNLLEVDILCTSHYLWNHSFLIKQLSSIRNQLKPDLKVIAGGPSIDVNNNKDFFKLYPYIDYAVYGAGEQAFADIVNHLVCDKPLIAFNTSNCAWKNNKTGQAIVADYKFVKMIETSPFVHNKKFFTEMISELRKTNSKIWLPYTLTRGCPYSCTFCDWNSGFGNKVSRRKNTFQQEIDLFQELKVTDIYLSDANVGQYEEDVEMIEYFAQKNLQENANFHIGGNFSKLKKENNLKIFHIMSQAKLVSKTLNFSIQDTNEEVLKNINRPDVGWEVHCAMADELREKYPHLIVKAQLIYGLPGQTPESWQQTLDQVTNKNILPIIFLNEPLPASPAIYDPEYQRKFQYEYIVSNRIIGSTYSSLIPKKSIFFDQHDLVKMNLLSAVYFTFTAINIALIEKKLQPLEIPDLVNKFLSSLNYQNLHDNLYHNWTVDNNFYYTIDFDGTPMVIADLYLGMHFVKSKSFLKYVSSIVPTSRKNEFLKLVVNLEFLNTLNEISKDVD